jgi:CDP-diacylglycerol--glycerol-3-phosphate 3-phosphatidyltransferase
MLKSEPIFQHCAYQDGPPQCRLQHAWWTACFFSLLFIMGGFSWLYFLWQPLSALQWMLQSSVIIAYILWLLRTGLKKNRSRQNEALHHAFGVANWLTIGRGFLIAALGGFLFQESPGSTSETRWLIWVPGAIYIIAALMDYLDGYLARAMRSETQLGEWLDTQIDALGLLVAPILAIAHDRLPFYYISVGLAYYIFQLGLRYRKKNNLPIIEIKPHPAKRMIAGFQMGLVAVALLPIFPGPAMTVAATIFMVPLLAGFFRDALEVGGYRNLGHLQQTRWDRYIDIASTQVGPVFLRLIISATVVFILYNAAIAFAAGKQSVTVAALDASMPLGVPALPILTAAGLMMALGFIARSMALLMSIMVSGTLTAWDSPFSLFVLLSCALILMLTGSGIGSLWQPENKLLFERHGQKRLP